MRIESDGLMALVLPKLSFRPTAVTSDRTLVSRHLTSMRHVKTGFLRGSRLGTIKLGTVKNFYVVNRSGMRSTLSVRSLRV